MGPFEGIRVLDLSRYGTGRYCTMILADLGAEVITIETPRSVGQSPAMMIDDTEAHYLGLNRNKKSIAVNLKSDEGKALFLNLVRVSDVVVETNRPGTLKRLGIDYETAKGINHRVIYCSVTGYGQDGPYAQRPGHDINFVAFAGILGLSGSRYQTPTYTVSPMIGDVLGGTTQATMAIMAALYARERTGEGQYIDVSSTDGAVFYHWVHAAQYFKDGVPPQRVESQTGSDAAWMNVYQGKDGKYFTLGCFEPWLWANLCRLVGREDFIPHHFGPSDKQKEMYNALSEVFAARDRDEWVKMLDDADVCVAPVYDFDEMFRDPHLTYRQVSVEVDHPRLGRMRLLNTPFKLSGTPAEVRTRPPLWAEHTRHVLQELLHCSDTDLERLQNEGVIE